MVEVAALAWSNLRACEFRRACSQGWLAIRKIVEDLVVVFGCRFQNLNSCVPVMQSAQDCVCDNVSEALDRASVWCILPKRNMRTPPVIIGGEFRKDPPQVLFVEHDQMIGTLAPDRPDQAFNMAVLPG